jgi:hypothetical protein
VLELELVLLVELPLEELVLELVLDVVSSAASVPFAGEDEELLQAAAAATKPSDIANKMLIFRIGSCLL